MTDVESENWVVPPDEVPEGRCGYATDYEDVPWLPANGTCRREPWHGHDRCIWHADADGKPADELAAARADGPERLDGAVLRGVEAGDRVAFADCVLVAADCTGADLRGVDLAGAALGRATLADATLDGATLTDASLRAADLADASLANAALGDADLFGADLADASLGGADLAGASLQTADLAGASLTDADLSDAELRGASLVDAALFGADLADAALLEADLTGADLFKADLAGATLFRADLTGADLGDAVLTGAVLEDAVLVAADLDGTDLTDARLHNCRLQDVYVSGATTFGDRCAYERAVESPGTADVETVEKAVGVYRTYQRLLRENSLPGDVSRYYYREKEMRRLKALATGDRRDWAARALQRWVMGYGERPWRVVGASVAVVVLCGLAYPLLGGVALSSGETTLAVFEPLGTPLAELPGGTWLAGLYFSLVTFTTLGYGDVQPASAPAQLLAGVESLAGAAMMALLVAVLARRITR